jgi:hypothetical protein
VTLIGYSVGGSKAIDIASILQSDPEIHIKGIVLLASVGLYEQKPIELAKNLLSDSFVRTPKNLAQETGKIETFGTWIRVGTDVARNMITETLASPGHIGKLRQGVQEVNSLPKCNRKMS